MTEPFKKLTEEVRAAISEHCKTQEAQAFVDATKAAEDGGRFEVIISTANIDRQGESIDQNGWDLSFYKQNPIVLWAHDYGVLPIGVCDEIEVSDGKLIAKGRFAPESANPFAQQVRRLYDLKIIRTTSVGFIVKEATGNKISKAELLEFSFVPVPANPYALSLAKAQELGINTAMLAMKGLNLETKAEGDVCTLEDGTEGVMSPDESGALICKPKAPAEKAEGDICTLEDGTEGEMKPNAEGALVCMPKVEEKPTKEEKGAVADEVSREETAKAKWEKISAVDNIIYALFDVFFDEETPVEAFDGLLAETIQLLQALTTSEAKATETVKARTDLKHAAQLLTVLAEKRGIKLSPSNHESLPDPTEKGSEGEVTPDGASPQQRSRSAGYDDGESLEIFLRDQSVLRLVNNVTSEALRKFNERSRASIKKHGRKGKAIC